MTKNIDSFKYSVAEMPESGRYWFRRTYWDENHGRERSLLITLESSFDNKWVIRLEDRKSGQYWQLLRMNIDGEEKKVFERFVRTKGGIKNDILSLGYLPNWIIEELVGMVGEIRERGIEEGVKNFLQELIENVMTDKRVSREKLTATVDETKIRGLYKINGQTKGDDRGSFREVVRFPEIELLTGYDFMGKQVNHSYSIYGTLRGLHVEPWAKLVTVISGLAASVFLDCRPMSKTYGKMETIYLGFGKAPDGTEVKGGAVFVEAGIANSFIVLSEKLDYSYVVDDLWTPGTSTYAVNPFDEKLNIPWTSFVPMDKIIRSERDMKSGSFEDLAKNNLKF